MGVGRSGCKVRSRAVSRVVRATGNFHFGKMVLGDHVEGALVVVTLEGTG